MTESDTATGTATAHDLRTIKARLADLQRKCRSAGSRNSDALEMEQRLASVLDRLTTADATSGDPIPFTALARELFAVERFFESNGFLTVAKEVAHVERALEALATAGAPVEPSITAGPERSGPTPEPGPTDGEQDDSAEPPVPRWAVPRPLAAVLVFFVAAVAVCGVVIVRHRQAQVAAAPTPLALPTAIPATPRPATPTSIPSRGPTAPAPGAVLATEVGKARLALVEGNVDATIDHLSRAALVDADHATVLNTAEQLIELLVERADAAAESGLWEVADLTLNRAAGIASRFGLDGHSIEQARARYARMDRFRLVRPSENAAIRAAAGSRVTVVLKDGATRESIVKGVEGGELLLDEDTELRGGALYYTERIPLAAIDYLKIWED